MSHLKQINQKLDTLLERVIVIESLLIRIKVAPPHKTIREEAEENANDDSITCCICNEVLSCKDKAGQSMDKYYCHKHIHMMRKENENENEHYWDPTKYPTVEDSDTIIGEANEHFKN